MLLVLGNHPSFLFFSNIDDILQKLGGQLTHAVLSEMPKQIPHGFHLFLPKGKVAHNTLLVSDRLQGPLRFPHGSKMAQKVCV